MWTGIWVWPFLPLFGASPKFPFLELPYLKCVLKKSAYFSKGKVTHDETREESFRKSKKDENKEREHICRSPSPHYWANAGHLLFMTMDANVHFMSRPAAPTLRFYPIPFLSPRKTDQLIIQGFVCVKLTWPTL